MKRNKNTRLNAGLQVLIQGTKRQRKFRDFLVPQIKQKGDAGFDLFVTKNTVIPPGVHLAPTDIPSGICIKLPKNTVGEIWPRSSTYINYPMLRICSAPIDENYTGPLNPRFQNMGTEPVVVQRGERLAQLVIKPVRVPKVYIVEKLPKTNRGSKRYGSSGK